MSLQTSITLKGTQYINELKKIENASAQSMQKVQQTTTDASKATQKLTDKLQVAGIKLGDLQKILNSGQGGAAAIEGMAAAASFVTASFVILQKAIANMNAQFEQMDRALKDMEVSSEKYMTSFYDGQIKNEKSIASTAAELRKLILSGNENVETKAKEEVLLERLKKIYKDITLEGKSQVQIAKELSDIEAERVKKANDLELKKLEQKRARLQREYDETQQKLDNTGSSSVLGKAGQWLYDKAQKSAKMKEENPLLWTLGFADVAVNSVADYGGIPGVTSAGEQAELSKKQYETASELALLDQEIKQFKENTAAAAEETKKLAEAESKAAEEKKNSDEEKKRQELEEKADRENAEQDKKLAANQAAEAELARYSMTKPQRERAQAFAKYQEEYEKQIEAGVDQKTAAAIRKSKQDQYDKDAAEKQRKISESNQRANEDLENQWRNTFIKDKNDLWYTQQNQALKKELEDKAKQVDENGNAVYDPYKLQRYGEAAQRKLDTEYKDKSIEDVLSNLKITDEAVKTNDLTRRGGFQGGAVVIDNTQRQMLEIQRAIKQVLEKVEQNTGRTAEDLRGY